jgi:hypothetical protein
MNSDLMPKLLPSAPLLQRRVLVAVLFGFVDNVFTNQ